MVYLIHFDEKLKHAQHYLGYSKDGLFEKRLEHHRRGTGSKLMRAIMKAGISWNVVRTWPNEDGNFERKLKKQGGASRICPICKQNKKNADNINTTESQV